MRSEGWDCKTLLGLGCTIFHYVHGVYVRLVSFPMWCAREWSEQWYWLHGCMAAAIHSPLFNCALNGRNEEMMSMSARTGS